MCHPGLPEPELNSSYNNFRPGEVAALTNPAVLAEAARLDLERVHFGALQPA
jgi:hypothetical protein